MPRPKLQSTTTSSSAATTLLKASSARAGDPWQRLRSVTVNYDGEWTRLVPKLQPVLADITYRKSSVETYEPRSRRVTQTHTGLAGTKVVVRTPNSISVSRNGTAATDAEERAAASLVADAYTVFTFGSSVLLARGSDWRLMGSARVGSEKCTLVSGIVKPGFGDSPADAVIAWIGNETQRLLRVQLTLNGLATTAGADVDVKFSDFQPGPAGTEWPRRYLEYVRRPLNVKAHDWRMTAIKVSR
jgi:hypothetical protein